MWWRCWWCGCGFGGWVSGGGFGGWVSGGGFGGGSGVCGGGGVFAVADGGDGDYGVDVGDRLLLLPMMMIIMMMLVQLLLLLKHLFIVVDLNTWQSNQGNRWINSYTVFHLSYRLIQENTGTLGLCQLTLLLFSTTFATLHDTPKQLINLLAGNITNSCVQN